MPKARPVIWSPQLRATPVVGGHSAIAAARMLAERQAERRQDERLGAELGAEDV